LQLRHALPEFVCVQWLADTDSTNAQLLARARQAGQADVPARPWLLGAHAQQRGRGRAGRLWQHRAGATLMFSCAFDVPLPPAKLPALSVLAGVAACEALRQWLSPPARQHLCLKWPNDVQWQGGKLAGLLLETARSGTAGGTGQTIVVMGMGLNLTDAPVLAQALQRPIADWCGIARADACAAPVSAAQMVAGLARAWQSGVAQALQQQALTALPQRFAAVDALYGQSVNVQEQGRVVQSGVACGVDDGGRLLLRLPVEMAAETLAENAPEALWPVTVGEVSVRVSGQAQTQTQTKPGDAP